jgi:hypothetical protein
MLQQYNLNNKEYISMNDYVFDGNKWVSAEEMIEFESVNWNDFIDYSDDMSDWDCTLMDGLDDMEYWNEKELID